MAWTRRHHDTFTDTGLTELPSHTPDQGTGYTNPAGAGIRPTIDTAGTGLRNGGDNGAYITTTIGADHKIQMVLKNASLLIDARLWVRYDVNGGGGIGSAANGFVMRINHGGAGTNTILIDAWSNGSRTNLVAAFTVNWANDDVVAFQIIANTMSAWRNGSEIAGSSVTDSSWATGTVAFSHETGADPCGDNLEVFDDTGGGGGGGGGAVVGRWQSVRR